MRLKIARVAAEEQLAALQNAGYSVLNAIRQDYTTRDASGSFDAGRAMVAYRQMVNEWGQQVSTGLQDIFPTELEANAFLNAPNVNITYGNGENMAYGGLRNRVQDLLVKLNEIALRALDRYTDLPIKDRLFVEDIDSFANVRNVNPHMVRHLLQNGYLPKLEDDVQKSLEDILGMSFHQLDSGCEINDLYATTLRINGRRVPTAFMLKGRGVKHRKLRIADCGVGGTQLVRLFDSPAELFVIQFVGVVDQMLVRDVESKVAARRAAGKPTWFLIMDGEDTARLLLAYGKLPETE